jgi:hypothetical protein
MAKKKELPKAMMGKMIKPVVRAIASGSKAVKNTKSFSKGITAAKTGYTRSVNAAKKAKEATKPVVSEEKRLMDELNTQKANAQKVNKTTSGKKPMAPQKKKRIKQAVVVGTAAAAAGIKYANRPRRTLND